VVRSLGLSFVSNALAAAVAATALNSPLVAVVVGIVVAGTAVRRRGALTTAMAAV
jgi:hypothetical protein